MASTTGFQDALLRGLAPTGIPKNLKGTVSERHDKKVELASRNPASMFKPTNLLLTKLILRPDTNSKPRSRDFMVQIFSQLPSPTKIVSSAN
ncbi:hypothetical protein QL285_025569 [Trifolium repens]|nr:hypothetical protein QL285_025569 [Trifolium repens]